MTGEPAREQLISTLNQTVEETLGYFEGMGRSSAARIDQWGASETLAHLPYWHYATAWGIASAGAGGPPWQVSAGADQTNATCLTLHQGESIPDLVAQLRRLHGRLVRVAAGASDLDAAAFRMPDGRTVSTGQRLETIARHWRGHLDALRQAGG